jgi:hypothetical protein
MNARRRPKLLTDADSIFRAAADHIHETSGQAIADDVRRAADAVDALVRAADAAVQAKALYYCQNVKNSDALALALTAWADRIDDLERAAAVLDGLPEKRA